MLHGSWLTLAKTLCQTQIHSDREYCETARDWLWKSGPCAVHWQLLHIPEHCSCPGERGNWLRGNCLGWPEEHAPQSAPQQLSPAQREWAGVCYVRQCCCLHMAWHEDSVICVISAHQQHCGEAHPISSTLGRLSECGEAGHRGQLQWLHGWGGHHGPAAGHLLLPSQGLQVVLSCVSAGARGCPDKRVHCVPKCIQKK